MRRQDNDVLSRRDFLRLTGLSGGAALLAACGASAPQSLTPATSGPAITAEPADAAVTVEPAGATVTAEPASATTPPAGEQTGEPVKLSFWTPGGSPAFCPTMWTKLMSAYSTAHPHVTFEEVQCGTGDQNFQEVLLARVAAGNPPDSTVLWVSPVSLGARGSLTALDELLAASKNSQLENWPPAVLASCQFGGKTWGLPVTAGTYGMWYNQDWFEEKGIPSSPADFPKTWDELRKLSKEFTRWNGDVLETAGFIPWGEATELPIWSALNGGKLYDAESQKYTLDTEPNIAMMEYVVSWLDEEYQGDITKVNNSAAWGPYPGSEGQPPAFQDQRLAMMYQGSWVMGDLYASVEPKFERWNVAPFPVGPMGTTPVSGYYPNWLVIPVGSKHIQESMNWLDFISVDGSIEWFSAIGDLPINKNIPRDLIPAKVVEKRGEAFAKEVSQFFFSQLDIATPMWDSPVQNFASDQISRALEQIMAKTASPKDALAEAQKACQAELDKVLQGTS